MTGAIRHFIEKYIVADVPNAMSACLDCKVVQCTADEWETCANRLARKSTLDHLPKDPGHKVQAMPESPRASIARHGPTPVKPDSGNDDGETAST